jgi:DNA replication licensing factor MCM4
MEPPSSPDSSSAGSVAAAAAAAAANAGSQSPARFPPPSPSTDNEEDNDVVVPATPAHNNNLSRTPNTPLTPLYDEDQEEEQEDANMSVQSGGAAAGGQQQQQQDGHGGYEPTDHETMTLARGTDVNVHTAANTFRDFLRTFRSLRQAENDENPDDENSDNDSITSNAVVVEPEPFYIDKLQTLLHRTASSSLDIDTMHLFYHNEACQRLYHQLVNYPMELVPLMDLVVQRELRRLLGDSDPNIPIPSVQVRPFNLKQVSNLRCLDPVAMDSLVCLKGMIVRCSPIIPDLKVAHFSCVICGHDHQVPIDRGRIQEPHQCQTCNTKESYQLIHTRSLFADKQLVRLQETPDQVPAGQTPASVITFCYDDLVDASQPGDKVEVTGVLRAQPIRVNPKITKLKSIYKTYVDVIHFRTVTGMELDKGKKGASTLTKDRVQQLQELSQRPDIYEQLTQSLAPSIWELDNVKKGVLCMLFGGNYQRVKSTNDVVQDSDRENKDEDDWSDDDNDEAKRVDEDTKLNKRGDINILLCGDPGTSKSQLLSYVHKLSARGVYTSGKGSSAVGLTASVIRDPETRDLVLESGALVLSDRGICCIGMCDLQGYFSIAMKCNTMPSLTRSLLSSPSLCVCACISR